jgi:uncharacterized protein YbjT (DUF2867 family)
MLGEGLLAAGWAVRGTSRTAAGLEAIEAAGIEPALADPERPGTILELVGDVAVLFYLLGSAEGSAEELEAIHGPRLESLMEKLVDTPVRGVVYEGAGSADPALLERGAGVVRAAGGTWHIPFEVTTTPPDAPREWARKMAESALWVLSPAGEIK